MVQRHALLALLLPVLVSCGSEPTGTGGGGRPEPGPPGPPATVSIEPSNAQTGTVGAKLPSPLVVRVSDAAGQAVSGVGVTWAVTEGGGKLSQSSSSTDAQGRTQVEWTLGTKPGANQVTATVGSLTPASFSATAAAGPLASISITGAEPRLKSGKQLQLQAVLKDAFDNTLSERDVRWQSSSSVVAEISSTGMVSAKSPGAVTISALSEGRSATTSIEVFRLPAATVTLSPAWSVVSVGASVPLRATALDAERDTASGMFGWGWSDQRSVSSPVLTLTGGAFQGAAPGYAVVRATLDNIQSNPAVVAVLGEGDLLVTGFFGDAPRATGHAGGTVSVPVVLDMSRTSIPGDIGALEMEITYDPALLVLKSATPGITGSVSQSSAPGRYRFAFASVERTPSARATLVTLIFEIAAGARPGSTAHLRMTYPSTPTSTGFVAYRTPVTVPGELQISAP